MILEFGYGEGIQKLKYRMKCNRYIKAKQGGV